MKFERDFYIKKGAVKIADRQSDAIAYVYEKNGVLFAQLFVGKQAKPAWHFRFRNAAEREKRITEGFADWRASLARKSKRKAERVAETHNYEIGHVLRASWGYDQTNVDFYQVTRVISPKMVELRRISSMSAETQTSMSGTVLPVLDRFTEEPIRRRANRHGVRVDSCRWASVWDGKPVFESSWH